MDLFGYQNHQPLRPPVRWQDLGMRHRPNGASPRHQRGTGVTGEKSWWKETVSWFRCCELNEKRHEDLWLLVDLWLGRCNTQVRSRSRTHRLWKLVLKGTISTQTIYNPKQSMIYLPTLGHFRANWLVEYTSTMEPRVVDIFQHNMEHWQHSYWCQKMPMLTRSPYLLVRAAAPGAGGERSGCPGDGRNVEIHFHIVADVPWKIQERPFCIILWTV